MKRLCVGILLALGMVAVLSGCKTDTGAKNEPVAVSEESATEQTTSGQTVSDQAAGVKAEATVKRGTLETVEITSESIAKNKMNESAVQNLYIYLPPSYPDGIKSYPVIYYLHGFGDEPDKFIKSSRKSFEDAFEADSSKEFIFVAVDGAYSEGGSFFVNSPVIGNWDDYITQEVVGYIDSNYRTIPDSDSRGICGFSMGGFSALNLALLHPDVFGATYGMSPGVIAPDKIGDALDTWKSDERFLNAYARAFAYGDDLSINIPKRDGTQEDNELIGRWESGFAQWDKKIEAYLALNKPLRAIGMSSGERDKYGWIPEGTKYLSGLLDEKGIEHTMFSFNGGHSAPPEVMEEHLFPFFWGALKWEE